MTDLTHRHVWVRTWNDTSEGQFWRTSCELCLVVRGETNDVTIDFDAAEALIALGAIQDKALEASRLAAISSGDEHEIADLSAKILFRLANRLTDALYPETRLDRIGREEFAAEVEFGLT